MDLLEAFGTWSFRWMSKAFPGRDFGMLHPQRSWIHTGDPMGLALSLFPPHHHFQELKYKEWWILCPERFQPLKKAGTQTRMAAPQQIRGKKGYFKHFIGKP